MKGKLLLAFLAIGFLIAVGLSAVHAAARPGESYHLFYSFPSEKARPVIFKYGAATPLKKLVDPDSLGVTFSLRNADKKPHSIRLELVNVPEGLHVHWSSFYDKFFDLQELKTLKPVMPYGRTSVHLTFIVGDELKNKPVIYSGGLKVIDLASGEVLLFIPIKIINVAGGG